MSLIRKLNNGKWNKPPVLTAARLVFAKGLAEKYPGRELGEMAEFVNGTSYDRGRLDMGDKPIIRISNITDPTSECLRTDEEFPERYHVSKGDLLVSWSASFKSILWPGPDGILNQHIFKVSESNGHIRSYIRHSIEAALDEMQQNVVGIGMMHLRRKDFLGHEVPCPPAHVQSAVADYLDWIESGCEGNEPALPSELEEQRRIVAKIEHLAAKIDQAHGLRERSFLEVEQWVPCVARQIFADGLPKRSERVDLGEIAEVRSGVTLGRQLVGDLIELPYLRVANVQDGYLDLNQIKTVGIKTEERDKWQLESGDLLLTEGGDWDKLGRGTVWRQEIADCIHQNHIFRVRLNTAEFVPDYVLAVIRSPFGKDYFKEASKQTTNLASINQRQLKAFPVFKVPLEVQRRIVTYLDGLQAKVDRLKALQQKTAAELDALLPSILDRAFKGEL